MARFSLSSVLAVSSLLLFCVVASPASAQAEFTDDRLEAVSLPVRQSLLARLEEYAAYDRNREYEKQYALFSDVALQAFDLRTKEAYVKSRENSYPILIAFKPLMSGYDGALRICRIGGEAELQWKDKRTTERLYLEAVLKNGEWYLSRMHSRLEDDFLVVEPLTTTRPIVTNKPVPKNLQKLKKPLR
jgi:hypothetical protein